MLGGSSEGRHELLVVESGWTSGRARISLAMWIGSSGFFMFFFSTLAWEANSGLTTLEQEELAFMKSLLEPLESEKRLANRVFNLHPHLK